MVKVVLLCSAFFVLLGVFRNRTSNELFHLSHACRILSPDRIVSDDVDDVVSFEIRNPKIGLQYRTETYTNFLPDLVNFLKICSVKNGSSIR